MLRKAAEDIFKIKFKTEMNRVNSIRPRSLMTNEVNIGEKSRVEMLSEDINNLKETFAERWTNRKT